MDGFQYEKPTSVAEAAALLAGAHGRAKILAGGTDLLVDMRSGLSQPELVVDVKRIPAMTEISLERRRGTGHRRRRRGTADR